MHKRYSRARTFECGQKITEHVAAEPFQRVRFSGNSIIKCTFDMCQCVSKSEANFCGNPGADLNSNPRSNLC